MTHTGRIPNGQSEVVQGQKDMEEVQWEAPTMPWYKVNVRTYVLHMLGLYVTILCNWLIL